MPLLYAEAALYRRPVGASGEIVIRKAVRRSVRP